MASVVFRGRDYGGESTSVSVDLGSAAVTSANFDAFVSSIGTLQEAIQDLTYIPLYEQFKAVDELVTSQALVEEGQREKKWRVRYRSTVTGKMYSIEIPGAILTGNLLPGTDFLNTAGGDGLAFVTAFEAEAREPGTNNTVEVINVQYVGRAI